MKISALFFAFVLLFAMPAQAEDARKVLLGDAEITLPQVAGFQEIYGVNEAFDAHVRAFVPPDNRLLAVYVTDEDAALIKTTPDTPLKRYMMVQATKSALLVKDDNDFRAIRDEIIKGTGASLKENQDVQKSLDDVSGYLQDHYHQHAKLQVGETRSLGAFMNYDRAFGIAMLANVGVQSADGAQDVPIATGISVMNIKGNALFVNAYTNYAGDEDADFVRNITKDYAAALFVANDAGTLKEATDPVPDEAAPKAAPEPAAPAAAEQKEQNAQVDTDSLLNTVLIITGGLCVVIVLFFLFPVFKRMGGRNKDESV